MAAIEEFDNSTLELAHRLLQGGFGLDVVSTDIEADTGLVVVKMRMPGVADLCSALKALAPCDPTAAEALAELTPKAPN